MYKVLMKTSNKYIIICYFFYKKNKNFFSFNTNKLFFLKNKFEKNIDSLQLKKNVRI